MSVVMVTRRSATVRGGRGHGVEFVPARLVGIVPGVRPVRLATMVAVLCAAVVAAVGLTASPAGRGGGGGVVAPVAGPGLQVVPMGSVGPISAVLGRDLPSYRVAGLTTTNVTQDLRAAFSSRGVTVVSGRLRLGIALDGYGYAGASGTVPSLTPVPPVTRANRVVYAHGALKEWWANGPAGLEQGFTVSSAPGVGTGPLTFSLGLSGNLRPRLGGGGLYLSGRGGALRYDDLVATDARGRALPARFALVDGRALIEVDDQGAAYPVRVDPLLQQSGELISLGGTPSGYFGRSVAVSGNTVAVAADNQTVGSREEAGAVYVFVEPTGGWSELMTQTAELVASDPQDLTGLGWSLAMSGNTIVAGTIAKCNKAATITSPCLNEGAAYVFEQPSGGWSGTLTENAVLTSSVLTQPTAHSLPGLFGSAVAMSGGTIVVGADGQRVASTNAGAAFVFEEPAGGWSGTLTQNAELSPSDPANNELFGDAALALSGSTVVVGAPGLGAPFGGPGHGAAYVFEEPAGGWHEAMTQSAELTAPPGTGSAELGASVSASGSTVAVGAPFETVGSDTDQGAVFVYSEPGAGWSGVLSPAAKLTASDGTRDNSFGSTLAASGSTIAVGERNGNPGSLNDVYLFSEPLAGWSGAETESSELVASNEATPDGFGSDVALSCSAVVVGAAYHHRLGSIASPQGAVYVFAPPTTTNTAGQGPGPGPSALRRFGSSSSSKGVQPALQAPKPNAPSGQACPLDVDVNVLQSLRSGLAVDNKFPGDWPVNFTVPTYGGQKGSLYTGPFEEGQKCVSGCANVLITVIDPATERPVKGAMVTASIDPIAERDMGDFAEASHDDQFLCVQSDLAPGEAPRCGTKLSGLATDQQGHAYLIYWAPGLVDVSQTTLNVSASIDTCAQGTCALKKGTALPPTKLTVHPYLVYQHTGVLAAKEVQVLVELAQEPNHFVVDMAADHYAQHLIEQALIALELFEHHAASIAGVAGLVVSTAVHAYEAYTKYGEQLGLIATLLEAEGPLSTLGLGEEAYAGSVPLDPSPYFTGHILDGLGNIVVPGLPSTGPSGILWSDAQALSQAQKHVHARAATPAERVSLKVYEVSHCRLSYPVCGPGYKHLPAQSSIAVENRHGIQAQLCFFFTGSDGLPGFNWNDSFCENQYAAPYWLASQPDINRTLP